MNMRVRYEQATQSVTLFRENSQQQSPSPNSNSGDTLWDAVKNGLQNIATNISDTEINFPTSAIENVAKILSQPTYGDYFKQRILILQLLIIRCVNIFQKSLKLPIDEIIDETLVKLPEIIETAMKGLINVQLAYASQKPQIWHGLEPAKALDMSAINFGPLNLSEFTESLLNFIQKLDDQIKKFFISSSTEDSFEIYDHLVEKLPPEFINASEMDKRKKTLSDLVSIFNMVASGEVEKKANNGSPDFFDQFLSNAASAGKVSSSQSGSLNGSTPPSSPSQSSKNESSTPTSSLSQRFSKFTSGFSITATLSSLSRSNSLKGTTSDLSANQPSASRVTPSVSVNGGAGESLLDLTPPSSPTQSSVIQGMSPISAAGETKESSKARKSVSFTGAAVSSSEGVNGTPPASPIQSSESQNTTPNQNNGGTESKAAKRQSAILHNAGQSIVSAGQSIVSVGQTVVDGVRTVGNRLSQAIIPGNGVKIPLEYGESLLVSNDIMNEGPNSPQFLALYQVLAGNFACFKSLPKETSLPVEIIENILKNLDWKLLSEEQQQELLKILIEERSGFRHLCLINCAINDKQLHDLLSNSPLLETLIIEGAPQLTSIGLLSLKNLKTLHLRNLKITLVNIFAPFLLNLFLDKLPKLNEVNWSNRASQLRQLHVSGCEKLDAAGIPLAWASRSHHLYELKLDEQNQEQPKEVKLDEQKKEPVNEVKLDKQKEQRQKVIDNLFSGEFTTLYNLRLSQDDGRLNLSLRNLSDDALARLVTRYPLLLQSIRQKYPSLPNTTLPTRVDFFGCKPSLLAVCRLIHSWHLDAVGLGEVPGETISFPWTKLDKTTVTVSEGLNVSISSEVSADELSQIFILLTQASRGFPVPLDSSLPVPPDVILNPDNSSLIKCSSPEMLFSVLTVLLAFSPRQVSFKKANISMDQIRKLRDEFQPHIVETIFEAPLATNLLPGPDLSTVTGLSQIFQQETLIVPTAKDPVWATYQLDNARGIYVEGGKTVTLRNNSGTHIAGPFTLDDNLVAVTSTNDKNIFVCCTSKKIYILNVLLKKMEQQQAPLEMTNLGLGYTGITIRTLTTTSEGKLLIGGTITDDKGQTINQAIWPFSIKTQSDGQLSLQFDVSLILHTTAPLHSSCNLQSDPRKGFIAIGSNETVKIWDPSRRNKPVTTLPIKGGPIIGMAELNGQLVCLGQGNVQTWDLDRQCLLQVTPLADTMTLLSVLPNGQVVVGKDNPPKRQVLTRSMVPLDLNRAELKAAEVKVELNNEGIIILRSTNMAVLKTCAVSIDKCFGFQTKLDSSQQLCRVFADLQEFEAIKNFIKDLQGEVAPENVAVGPSVPPKNAKLTYTTNKIQKRDPYTIESILKEIYENNFSFLDNLQYINHNITLDRILQKLDWRRVEKQRELLNKLIESKVAFVDLCFNNCNVLDVSDLQALKINSPRKVNSRGKVISPGLRTLTLNRTKLQNSASARKQFTALAQLQLPELEELYVRDDSSIAFDKLETPALKVLVFEKMSELKRANLGQKKLPLLDEFRLVGCPKLALADVETIVLNALKLCFLTIDDCGPLDAQRSSWVNQLLAKKVGLKMKAGLNLELLVREWLLDLSSLPSCTEWPLRTLIQQYPFVRTVKVAGWSAKTLELVCLLLNGYEQLNNLILDDLSSVELNLSKLRNLFDVTIHGLTIKIKFKDAQGAAALLNLFKTLEKILPPSASGINSSLFKLSPSKNSYKIECNYKQFLSFLRVILAVCPATVKWQALEILKEKIPNKSINDFFQIIKELILEFKREFTGLVDLQHFSLQDPQSWFSLSPISALSIQGQGFEKADSDLKLNTQEKIAASAIGDRCAFVSGKKVYLFDPSSLGSEEFMPNKLEHESPVSAISMIEKNNQFRYLLSASDDKVRVWEGTTCIKTLAHDDDQVIGVAALDNSELQIASITHTSASLWKDQKRLEIDTQKWLLKNKFLQTTKTQLVIAGNAIHGGSNVIFWKEGATDATYLEFKESQICCLQKLTAGSALLSALGATNLEPEIFALGFADRTVQICDFGADSKLLKTFAPSSTYVTGSLVNIIQLPDDRFVCVYEALLLVVNPNGNCIEIPYTDIAAIECCIPLPTGGFMVFNGRKNQLFMPHQISLDLRELEELTANITIARQPDIQGPDSITFSSAKPDDLNRFIEKLVEYLNLPKDAYQLTPGQCIISDKLNACQETYKAWARSTNKVNAQKPDNALISEQVLLDITNAANATREAAETAKSKAAAIAAVL